MSDSTVSVHSGAIGVGFVVAVLILSLDVMSGLGTATTTVGDEPTAAPNGAIAAERSTAAAVSPTVPAARQAGFIDRNAADAALRSGGLFFAGQTLGLEIPAGVNDAENFELRRYDRSDKSAGGFVREFAVGDDDRTELSTDRLRGNYVVTVGGDRSSVVRFGSDGVATGVVDAGNARPFEVTEQSLRIEWGQERITTGDDDVELNIRSNRARYNLNVSADGLDFEDLEALFREGGVANDPEPHADRQPFEIGGTVYDAYADDDILVVRGPRDGSLTADFTEIDAGAYRFSFEVTDTGVTSGAGVGDDDTDPPETEPEPAFFDVTDLEPTDLTVDPGEELTVSARVRNIGGTAGTGTVAVEVDGEVLSERTVDLDVEEGTDVPFSVTAPETAGEYVHSISTDNASVSGSLRVVEPDPEPESEPEPEPEPEPDPEPDPEPEDQAGFGLVAAGIAFILLCLTARRCDVTP